MYLILSFFLTFTGLEKPCNVNTEKSVMAADTIGIDLNSCWSALAGIGWNINAGTFQWGNWDSIKTLLDESNMQFARIIGHMEFWYPDSNAFTPTSDVMNSIYKFLDYCEENNVTVMFHNWWTGGKYDNYTPWPNHYFWLARCCYLDPTNSLSKWNYNNGWTSSGPETDQPYDADKFAYSIYRIVDYMWNTKHYRCIKYLGLWNEPNGLWAYAPRDMDNSGSPDYSYPTGFYVLYNKMNWYLDYMGIKDSLLLVGNDVSYALTDAMDDIGTTLSAWEAGHRCDDYIQAVSFHSYGTVYGAGGPCNKVRNQIYNNNYDSKLEPIVMGEIGDDAGDHTTTQGKINNSFDCAKKIIAEAKQGAYAIAKWWYNGGDADGFSGTLGQGERPMVQNFYPTELMSASIPRMKNDRYVMGTYVSSSGGYLDAVDIRFWCSNLGRNADAIWVVNDNSVPRIVSFNVSNVPVSENKTFYKKYINMQDTLCPIISGRTIYVSTANHSFVDTLPAKSIVVYSEYDKLIGVKEDKNTQKIGQINILSNPNPFMETTEIEYMLPGNGNVDITIYNVGGEKVKTLVSENKAAGNYGVRWDGKSESGERVSSGVYFCRLKTDGNTTTKKLHLVK
ncbi:MAG: FlgD immunoglobulin-like domain containing protein [bacterium]